MAYCVRFREPTSIHYCTARDIQAGRLTFGATCLCSSLGEDGIDWVCGLECSCLWLKITHFLFMINKQLCDSVTLD